MQYKDGKQGTYKMTPLKELFDSSLSVSSLDSCHFIFLLSTFCRDQPMFCVTLKSFIQTQVRDKVLKDSQNSATVELIVVQ